MKKKTLLIMVFLMMLYIGPVLFISSSVHTASPAEQNTSKDFAISADWYNDAWLYRKEVIMGAGTDGAGTDYPVKVEVTYDSGMQADFDDIRFTDDDNVTLLDHWRETYIASTSATFWVEVKDSQQWGTWVTFLMYFGNDAVSTASDGDATFLFFDDFEDQDFNEWYEAGAYWSTQSDEKKHGSYAAYGDAGEDGDSRELFANISAFGDADFMVHMWGRSELETSREYYFRSADTDAGSVYALMVYADNDFTYDNGPETHWEENTASDDTWIELEIAFDFTNEMYRFYRGGSLIGSTDLEDKEGDDVTEMNNWQFYTDTGDNEDMWLDDVYARKWVDAEPTVASFGEKEFLYPPAWELVGNAELIFFVPADLWAWDMFLILLGLCLIPISTVYLVYGGKNNFSTDKLFYGLIMLLMGVGLIIGGIM